MPRENLLDRFAAVSPEGVYASPIPGTSRRFFTMLGTLIAGRVSVSLAAVTAAKVGLTIAVRYGSGRRQFGPAGRPEVAVLDYPSHQRRLMPRLAACFALDFAGKALNAVLAPSQWDRISSRLASIQNPTVAVKPSRYSLKVRVKLPSK